MTRFYHTSYSPYTQLDIFTFLEEQEEEPMKLCPTCIPVQMKKLSEFGIDNARKDKHTNICLACRRRKYNEATPDDIEQRKAIRKASEDLRREEIRANDRLRHNTEEHRSKRRDRHAQRNQDPHYRQQHHDRTMEWLRNHPFAHREYCKRRKIIKKATSTASRISYKNIIDRDGYWCYLCSQNIDPTLKIGPARIAFDHVIPLSPRSGEPQGTHTEENIRPTHYICNARKRNRRLEDLTDFDRRGPDIRIRERRTLYTIA